ncbi:MAG: hypothetical protein ABSG13_11650 [Bryobacteraceae bacterium]|jgi:hypothetical protein
MKWHCGGRDTTEDKAVIDAINGRALDPTGRQRQVVHWLEYYKVLMFVQPDRKTAMANEIIGFADGPREDSLHRNKDGIVSEFDRLGKRICKVAKPKKSGEPPALTSLTSKALWCCYPNDVPVFDDNAARALGVISRLCHLVPAPKQLKYACFVDVWLQVYNEVESVISPEDLSDCPYKVRVLDRLLWYLGQRSFYDEG